MLTFQWFPWFSLTPGEFVCLLRVLSSSALSSTCSTDAVGNLLWKSNAAKALLWLSTYFCRIEAFPDCSLCRANFLPNLQYSKLFSRCYATPARASLWRIALSIPNWEDFVSEKVVTFVYIRGMLQKNLEFSLWLVGNHALKQQRRSFKRLLSFLSLRSKHQMQSMPFNSALTALNIRRSNRSHFILSV